MAFVVHVGDTGASRLGGLSWPQLSTLNRRSRSIGDGAGIMIYDEFMNSLSFLMFSLFSLGILIFMIICDLIAFSEIDIYIFSLIPA